MSDVSEEWKRDGARIEALLAKHDATHNTIAWVADMHDIRTKTVPLPRASARRLGRQFEADMKRAAGGDA